MILISMTSVSTLESSSTHSTATSKSGLPATWLSMLVVLRVLIVLIADFAPECWNVLYSACLVIAPYSFVYISCGQSLNACPMLKL